MAASAPVVVHAASARAIARSGSSEDDLQREQEGLAPRWISANEPDQAKLTQSARVARFILQHAVTNPLRLIRLPGQERRRGTFQQCCVGNQAVEHEISFGGGKPTDARTVWFIKRYRRSARPGCDHSDRLVRIRDCWSCHAGRLGVEREAVHKLHNTIACPASLKVAPVRPTMIHHGI